MIVEQMLPADAAACLVYLLESRGAIFSLTPTGHLHADLDGVLDDRMPASDEAIAQAILGLADEIKSILRARATRH